MKQTIFCLIFSGALGVAIGNGSFAGEPPHTSESLDSAPVDQESLDRKLRFAAETGQLKYAKQALDQGARVNSSDAWGMTALMMASLRGHYKMARYLLARGADPNLSTDRDVTAIHLAAKNCAHPVVLDLILAGARVNVKTAHEQTPVSAAAEQGCSRVVRELVKVKGLDLDSKDVSGKTALDYAREADVTGYDSESYDLIMAKLFPFKKGASLIREGTLP